VKVLITGDRGWTAAGVIETVIKTMPPDTIIVHGDASGADMIAAAYANARDMSTWAFPAQWQRWGGRRAGPMRNQRMIDEAKPDLVVAFHNYLPGSKGTRDMVTKARLAGIPVQLFNAEGVEVEVTDEMLAPPTTVVGNTYA